MNYSSQVLPHPSTDNPIPARKYPSQQPDLRKLFFEMNIGYQIQRRWPTNEEVGFYCIATSYLRKDSAMERITEFVNKHLMPYEVIDGEGLTFFVHDMLN